MGPEEISRLVCALEWETQSFRLFEFKSFVTFAS